MSPHDMDAILERLLRLIVRSGNRLRPPRPGGPFTIAEIRDTVLPYRASRKSLGVDSMEDYDTALLTFLAGTAGRATLDDPALTKVFLHESRGSNPDLSLLAIHGAALFRLDPASVANVLAELAAAEAAAAVAPAGDAGEAGEATSSAAPAAESTPAPVVPVSELVQAPPPAPSRSDRLPTSAPRVGPPPRPAPAPAPAPEPEPPIAESISLASLAPVMCLYCGGSLPVGRQVKFCPHCGQNQQGFHCPACSTEAEPGWKHCVSCGSALPSWP